MKNKEYYANVLPDWLLELPPGHYCINQLCEMTGRTYAYIYQRLMMLDIKTYSKTVDLSLGLKRRIIFYIWEGYESQYDKINTMRLKQLAKKNKKGVKK